MALSTEGILLLNDLLIEDFSLRQIKDFLEDGEALKKEGISREIAQEIHCFLLKNWKEIQQNQPKGIPNEL